MYPKFVSLAHEKITDCIIEIRQFMNRRRLKNKDFSLFVSNCTGGLIYHELGIQFRSPFINLQMDSAEFIEFMLNLGVNLDNELTEFEISDFWKCPVAKCASGGTVIFTHYHTIEDAKNKWEERKKRIQYENIYVITNDCGVPYETIKEFEKLGEIKGIKNFVIFTAKEYADCPHALYLKDYKGKEYVTWGFHRSKFLGRRYYEKIFDYVGFLNSDHDDVRKYLKRK